MLYFNLLKGIFILNIITSYFYLIIHNNKFTTAKDLSVCGLTFGNTFSGLRYDIRSFTSVYDEWKE